MGISGSGDFKRFVANADTLFKVFQTIILFPCSGLLVKLSKKVIHSKGNEEHDENEMVLKYIGVSGAPSSSTAMVEIVQEIERMALMVRENLEFSTRALIENDRSASDDVYKREKYIDFLSHRITEYMVKANQYGMPIKDRERLGGLFHVVIDVERIGDHAVNIMDDSFKEKNKKINFSNEGKKNL